MYDIATIRKELTIDQVFSLVEELGGSPRYVKNDVFVAETICHNHSGEGSHKLYYYDNTKLFKCYTECNCTFDIIELVIKQHKIAFPQENYSVAQAVEYVAQFFGLDNAWEDQANAFNQELPDWQIFERYNKELVSAKQTIELKTYDAHLLDYFPQPHIIPWENEGISYEIIKKRNICFDPLTHSVIIPHYDIYGNLIGIRERTLVKEDEKFGKYKPAIINNKMYNHPLGFNLYNLNYSKDNIKALKKAIIFEGEKSSLQYASYFGENADISCAVCGSSFLTNQVKLLLSLNIDEIIIGFDKQFQQVGDEEWKKWTKKLIDFHDKYGAYVQISYLFDKDGLLGYKDSPTDRGADILQYLIKNRIFL